MMRALKGLKMMKLEGFDEVMKNLQDLGQKHIVTASKKAAKEISKEIVKEYKKNVPKQTGLLRSHAVALMSKSKEKGVYKATALVRKIKSISEKAFAKRAKKLKPSQINTLKRKSVVYYAHFVEYGFLHKGGRIKSPKNKSLETRTRIKGQFIMQKAAQSVEKRALNIASKVFDDELKKARL